MFPWYSSAMLAFEANQVIGLRIWKLACGRGDVGKEMSLMVTEKIAAAMEAGTTLSKGGDLSVVVGRYRQHVASNANRLAKGLIPNKPTKRRRRRAAKWPAYKG